MSTDQSNDPLWRAAAKCGYPDEAVEFVSNCLCWTPYNPDAVEGHLSAADLCRTFLESAVDEFLDQTEQTLKEWRIEKSEDLGRIVDALIAEGLVRKREEDRASDFEGVFDLERQHFSWDPMQSESARSSKEESETKAILRVMKAVGMLLSIVCLVLAAGAESRSRLGFIVLAAAMTIVPWSLSLLVAHGYRKVRTDDPGR